MTAPLSPEAHHILADDEYRAYRLLVWRMTELQALGAVDRHSNAFAMKAGAVSEAIEIWRAVRHCH